MVEQQLLRAAISYEIEKFCQEYDLNDKDSIRDLHKPAVINELEKGQTWINSNLAKYQKYFANGIDINPIDINPILIEVIDDWQRDLFRLARYTWSLPYTKGYGRRLRFIILDQSNGKLMGIIGLQSPPIDFPARDNLFSYPKETKVELINQTMDIFTLGAIPPYNKLLGGKLVALAVTCNEIREAYIRKYSNRITIISKRQIPANLVCLTTTSAFGRSSIYNRLKYRDELVAKSIGYTEGYGSFHLTTLYPLIRQYLEANNISTHGGFGVGPKIVWQSCVRVQQLLGLSKDILKHGIKREVFIFPLIHNLWEFMEGKTIEPDYIDRPFDSIVYWWRERWLEKRAFHNNGWHEWENNDLLKSLKLENRDA